MRESDRPKKSLEKVISSIVHRFADTDYFDGHRSSKPFSFSEEEKQALHQIHFKESDICTLQEFLSLILGDPNPTNSKNHFRTHELNKSYCILEGDSIDKEARRQIHEGVRNLLPFLESSTPQESRNAMLPRIEELRINSPSKTVPFETPVTKPIKISLKNLFVAYLLGQDFKPPVRTDTRWPNERPSYLHFNMFKANRDTADAIGKIARATGINVKSFAVAGTKDKRGCTVQRVSAFKVSKEILLQATTMRTWDKSIRLSDFEYSENRIKLGDLKGNQFKLVIRDVDPADFRKAEKSADHLKDHGFINYFGHQRFGTKRIQTQHIGAMLLNYRFEDAVRFILGDIARFEAWINKIVPAAKLSNNPLNDENIPPADENGSGRSFKRRLRDEGPDEGVLEYLERGDIRAALRGIDHRLYIERKILETLKDDPKGFVPALQSLPKNVRSLYYHACQSLVWNAVASERFALHGDRVVVGDLVCSNRTAMEEQIGSDEQEEEEADSFSKDFAIVEITNEEQASFYSKWDIMLPLPGENIVYPPILKSIYEEKSQELLGISLRDFVSDKKYAMVTLEGSYRYLFERVWHFEFHALSPGEFKPNSTLIASDLDYLLQRDVARQDRLRSGIVIPASELENAGHVGALENAGHVGALENAVEAVGKRSIENAVEAVGKRSIENALEAVGKGGCILLSCSLPRSSYLTSAIREILKKV